MILSALLTALLVASLALLILSRYAARLPQASPGARGLHQRPVARVAGLSMLAGACAAAPLAGLPAGITPALAWAAALACGAVAAISLQDDRRSLPAALRLAVHLAAALLFVWTLPLGAALALPAALAIAWMANLYNFMDGSDGLAASAAVIGFAAYACGASLAGGDPSPYAVLAAAALPMLAVNLPPARMFIGDVGAVTLGFLAAALGIAGAAEGSWPPWFPLLVWSAPILDASLTLSKRLLRGERLWEAHRSHYYQRFHRLGAGHRGTLALYAALAVAGAALALAFLAFAPRLGWAALVAWTTALAVLFAAIDYHWKRRMPGR